MNTIEQLLSSFSKNNTEFIIPVFQVIQEEYGFLSLSAIKEVSRYFGISSEQIYSILSFYPQFRFKPKGKYHIEVCYSTLCKMNYHQEIISFLKKIIGIAPGEISSDSLFSLDYGMCTGICKKHIRVNNNAYLISSLDEIKSIIDKNIKEVLL